MKTIVSILLLTTGVACSSDPDALTRHNASTDDPSTPPGSATATADPPAAACTSRDYASFDGKSLTKLRPETALGVDRGRLKPFEALASEYARVLGAAPASLAASATTFSAAPKRWYVEPQASAVTVETIYAIAFDGCLDFTASAPEYANAPDAASAATECAAMARKFWSKTPSPAEIAPCVSVATTGAAAEPDARRKWAYACASVLTAAGFVTY